MKHTVDHSFTMLTVLTTLTIMLMVTRLTSGRVIEPEKCAGGYYDGQIVDRGRYWYKCEEGRLLPMGCFADDRSRLDIHGSFKTRGYVLECYLDNRGDLRFRFRGCLSEQGVEFRVNESWQDDRYWYLCTVEGDHLRTEIGGCVDKNKRFGIGGTIEKDGFLYQCRRSVNQTGSGSMCPVACMHEGRRYNVGETYEVGKYWYTCTNYQGRLAKICAGCMHKDARLKDGDRYVQRDSVFECEIRNNTQPDHRLIGCRDDEEGTVIERNLGCEWTRGKFPIQYVFRCTRKEGQKIAYKEVVRCFYKGYDMLPGCFRVIDDEVAMCKRSASGQVTLETRSAKVHLQNVFKWNLNWC